MRILRIILFPFSLIYATVLAIRNYLFNKGILKSVRFSIDVINVGNLRVGGTGKTPHVEFLAKRFKDEHKLAILSRGYGRETRGFLFADDESDAREIGDEPLQYYQKFKDEIPVAVGEDRVLAIPQILKAYPEQNMIILDDAFQHRYVNPNCNILLTSFDQPFYRDFILPTGMLRESPFGARRADIIVVSKCPGLPSEEKKEKIKKRIRKFSGKRPIFFSTYKYGEPHSFRGDSVLDLNQDVVLISGLANSEPLTDYVREHYNLLEEKRYPDHYDYYSEDIEEIAEMVERHSGASLLCSEKDFVKLSDGRFPEINDLKAFYLPIEVDFGPEESDFITEVKNCFVKA